MAPVPRGARLVLALLPLVFTGKAFLIGGVYGPADLYYGHDPWKHTVEAQAIGPVRNPILSDVAFANIRKAAKHYGIDISEKNWQELGSQPHGQNRSPRSSARARS